MICRAIPYEGNEPYIFFSYSHKDSERVYPLLEQLVRDGYRVWYDDANHPGDDWLENIGLHLDRCHLCLAFLSQNSEESHNCKKEVSFAVQCNKKLMAVKLEEFPMTIGMRLQLSTIHYLVRTEYPSDKALLEKLYETEGMQQCRAFPGSLRMRTFEEAPAQKEEVYQGTGALQSFVAETIPERNEEPRREYRPVSEPRRVNEVPRAKPQRVKAKLKTIKKVRKQEDQPGLPTVETAPQVVPEEPAPQVIPEEPAPQVVPEEPAPQVVPEEPAPQVVPEEPDPRIIADEIVPQIIAEEPAPKVFAEVMTSRLIEEEPDPRVIADETVFKPVSVPERAAQGNAEHTTLLTPPESNAPQMEEHSKAAQIMPETTIYAYNDAAEIAAAMMEQPGCGRILLLRLADGTSYISHKKAVQVGRSEKRCDIVLKNNNQISNHHANIILEDNNCYLQDAGSSNGTFLNGQRLQANRKVLVENGTMFRICKEEFLLVYGADLELCIQRGAIAFLRNPATGNTKLLRAEAFPLDRQHQWADGSLSHGNISRTHAQICCCPDGYYLEELGSRNGTLCNERRLGHRQKCLLSNGDRIRIVDTVLEFNIVTF